MTQIHRSRWYHRVTLHSPGPGVERKVEWLELFYDLVYVATIIQLGNALSHSPSVVGFAGFVALFVPIWWTWTGFTFYSNRFVVDDFAHRILVFGQMFAIGGIAASVPRVFEHDNTLFALSNAATRLLLFVMYARAWRDVPKAREMSSFYARGYGVTAVLWGISVLLPEPWVYLLWGASIVVDFGLPIGRHARALNARFPLDVVHFSERYGLLTIIVLGEAFVKVLTILADRGDVGLEPALMCAVSLTITCSLWWIYFDDVAGSRIKNTMLSPIIWVYAHLPLTIGITAVGVGVKKAIILDPGQVAPAKYRWLLAGTLGLAWLAVAIVDSVTERRQADLSDELRTRVRGASAFFVLLIAPAGGFLPAWGFLALIAGASVLQVLFDLSMAPIQADPHAAHHESLPSWAHAGHEADEEVAPAKKPRRDVGDAVRKGTPSELRRDLYYHLMDGSWTRLMATLTVLYLASNVVFAALYLIEPGSVAGLRAGSFQDAFFFSVQTMTTIGYGVLHPVTPYGDVLVTVEAAIGVFGVALATGLMFAKASRPRGGALFSKVFLITKWHGKRTLMFRVGNARGNDVVEANVRVAAVVERETEEGHLIRRLLDLRLERSETPLFAISWTIFHPIEEDSPFFGMSDEEIREDLLALVCSLTGYDATYAQQIHARHTYDVDDLVFDRYFADTISTLPDGRLLVDYEKFHDTEPPRPHEHAKA